MLKQNVFDSTGYSFVVSVGHKVSHSQNTGREWTLEELAHDSNQIWKYAPRSWNADEKGINFGPVGTKTTSRET